MLSERTGSPRDPCLLTGHVGHLTSINGGGQSSPYSRVNLDAVAVGDLAVLPAGIVRVEEVLVVVLVPLPPREQEANADGDNKEDGQQRRLVGAQRLEMVRVGGKSNIAGSEHTIVQASAEGLQRCVLCACRALHARQRRTRPVPSPPTPLARGPKSRAPLMPPMPIVGTACHG